MVSIFGLQLAQIAGVRSIITSSSDEKLARAREHGADETINYREHDNWESIVRDLTDDRGVDLTLEVGGEGTLAKSMMATRFGGEVALIGGPSYPSSRGNHTRREPSGMPPRSCGCPREELRTMGRSVRITAAASPIG